MKKRQNKSKKEIVHDIKAVENAKRIREKIRSDVYPFLLELNNNIGYTKIFLQTSATAVETAFMGLQKTMKVSDLIPKINEVFTTNDPKLVDEFNKYKRLLDIMKDENVYDFLNTIQMMPRVIEQYFTHQTDKHPVLDIQIDKILG